MAGNFIYDNTALYDDKVDPNPVTVPTQQWAAEDAALVKQALLDIRTVLQGEHANVRSFGAVGDGVADDTAEIQAAINATQGIPLFFPKGTYRVSATLFALTRSHRFVGDFGNRSADGGTQIIFYGTGPCFQIGVDDGNPWDANEYNGPQDQVFENIWISHGAPDTALVSNPGGGSVYKSGAYGIWDWRGGQIVLRNVGLEKFEANFVGINSDINSLLYVVSLYSKYGIYIGPRSDQFSLHQLLSFLCDRAVTVDRANVVRIVDPQIIGCGTPTCSAIEVRQGSATVTIDRAWFEHLLGTGYAGTDQQSFVSAGEVAGYGVGGSIASPGAGTTTSVEECNVIRPMFDSELIGNPGHTKYGVTVGKCHRFVVDAPATPVGFSLTNFDALVAVQAAFAPTAADTQISIDNIPSGLAQAKVFVNLGAGSPTIDYSGRGSSGFHQTTGQRFFFNTFGAVVGADQVRLSQEGNSGEIWLATPNKAAGQTTRFRIARSRQTTFVANGPPTAGTWEVGDTVDVLDQTQTGYRGFYCWVAGTPGVWAPYGRLEGRELTPATLAGNQNDYAPASWSSSRLVILSASTPVNLTGLLAPPIPVVSASLVGLFGTERILYNNSANAITLTNQDVLSLAANRIIGRGGANTVLTANTSVEIYYSPSLTRWLVTADTL